MFLVINIVFILLIIRISLNGKILRTMMTYRWRLLLRYQHIFFFLCFTVITAITGNYFLAPPTLFLYIVFVLLPNMGVYYLVYAFLVPKYYLANKYPTFILYSFLVFIVSALFRILLEPTLFSISIVDNSFAHANFLYLVYSLQALVILIASFLGITKDKFLIEQDFQNLGEEKEQLYLDLMRSKLSPHFLLNTLNNIYVKSLDPQQATSDSILQLSKLLQYVIYDAAVEKISLAKEFASIKALQLLYQLKYHNKLNINLNIEAQDSLELLEIPPAILLTLFENSLKHSGIGLDSNSFIDATYSLTDNRLFFQISNYLPARKSNTDTGYKGLGNQAILKMLDKYYAEQYTFDAQLKDAQTYVTTLTMEL